MIEFDLSQLDIPLCYLSGLLAAGSPCVVVLIPLILYRFRDHRGHHHQTKPSSLTNVTAGNPAGASWMFHLFSWIDPHLVWFILGFLVTYCLLGFLATGVLSSPVQNGFRLAFGSGFMLLGSLSVNGRINPVDMPFRDNSLLLGVGFATLISVNPCTLPFLAIVISLHTSNALISLLFFGMGLLTPSLLFVFLGKASIKVFTQFGFLMQLLNKLMNWVLCASGVYLMLSIYTVSILDLLVAGVVFMAEIAFLRQLYSFKSHWPSIVGFLLFSALLVAFVITPQEHSITAHYVEPPKNATIYTPSADTTLPPADAAPMKCIDPSLLFCQVCQIFIIGHALSASALSTTVFALENDWIRQRLPFISFLAPKEAVQPEEPKGVRIPSLPSALPTHQPTTLKAKEEDPQLSAEELRVYHEKLWAVRHRIMGMV